MPAKISTHVFKGMQKDINVVNSSNEYLFDAHNIRLNLLDDNTLMSIVNEKGNELITFQGDVTAIEGNYVSSYVVDNHIVVFTHNVENELNINRIYRIDADTNSFTLNLLFEGDLNISPLNPLEFTSYFESNEVIKIYWVDGVNQLRFMNIMVDEPYDDPNDFNTTPELTLNETVTVKQIDGNGLFPAGVIQYALTYVNKLGAESNIFYVTKLHSILFKNRAASPLEFINCTFLITVDNIDVSFDYIRCYQLLRTSLDAQPTCLILNEIPINGRTTIDIFDNNNGSAYDATALLFQKYPIIASTLDLKSNTLFLGNLDEKIFEIPEGDRKEIMDWFSVNGRISFVNADNNDGLCYSNGDIEAYRFNPNADIIRTFKSGEVYRIGILFQDEYGVWSLPIYIKDLEVDCTLMHINNTVYPICFQYTNSDSVPTYISKYKRFRFLMVNPSSGDRSRLVQGLVTPTMYELSDRIFNTPHAYSSWFARPFNSNVTTKQNYLVPAGKDWEAEMLAQLLAKDVCLDLPNDWYTSLATWRSPYATDFEDSLTPATLSFDLNWAVTKIDNSNVRLDITLANCIVTKGTLVLKDNVLYDKVLSGSPYTGVPYESTYYLNYTDGHLVLVDYVNATLSGKIIDILAATPSGSIFRLFTDDTSQLSNLQSGLNLNIDGAVLCDTDMSTADLRERETDTLHIQFNSLNIKFDSLYYEQPSSAISVFGFNGGSLSDFRIDHSILNLYSPDINNQYYEIHHNDHLTLNLVGYSEVTSLLDNVYLKLENAGSSSNSVVNPYFNFREIKTSNSAFNTFNFTRGLFKDSTVYKRLRDGNTVVMRESGMFTLYNGLGHTTYTDSLLENSHAPMCNFAVYPWHGAGSLNNEDNTEGQLRSATYQKIFAKEWICNNTNYYDIDYQFVYRKLASEESADTHNVSNCKLDTCFVCNNTNNISTIKQDGISRTYIGNPDLARTFVNMKNGIIQDPLIEFGYDIYIIENDIFKKLSDFNYYAHTHNSDGKLEKKILFRYYEDSDIDLRYPQANNEKTSWKPIVYKTDPIQIKYNADTHVIIPIDRNNNVLSTLPSLSTNDDGLTVSTYFPVWDNQIQYTDVIPKVYDKRDNRILCDELSSYFHIGELVRTITTRYNGTINFTESYDLDNPVLISNVFIPIMESEPIDNLSGTIKTKYGDTWYGRWDCMKTQHKTDLDEQSVHDYVSIMIESHINLNGRYDSYRNFYDLTLVNALNANKFNDVYSQMDTFWSYKVIPNYLKTTYYPNQITWSLTKLTGALVDEWTKVTAANIQELDGNKGPINKILNYKDSLFVFQDRCISLIKYNEQTQMTTTEGVPVEISNSQKVTGIVKIYDGTGCVNKWSIASDANGVFFVDNVNECMMWLGGSLDTPIVNLTNSKAFTLFMKANNSFDVWNPEDFSNFVTFIDSAHKDVYFVNNNTCLCFSLALLEFTSFYSYEGTFNMFNIDNNFYSLYDKNGVSLYRNFTGKYNEIYGVLQPSNFIFIDHGESFLTDKTFTNINYIQDAYNVNGVDGLLTQSIRFTDDYDNTDYYYEKDVTFLKLRVWTPFLDTGDITLTPNEDLQRKFRTWGILISRDLKYNISNVDRIRNNWAKFKFTFTQPDYNEEGLATVTNPRDIKIELMNINVLSIE